MTSNSESRSYTTPYAFIFTTRSFTNITTLCTFVCEGILHQHSFIMHLSLAQSWSLFKFTHSHVLPYLAYSVHTFYPIHMCFILLYNVEWGGGSTAGDSYYRRT